jgi:hypothetical protein
MRKNKKRSSSKASDDIEQAGNELGTYGFQFNEDEVMEDDPEDDGELYTRI